MFFYLKPEAVNKICVRVSMDAVKTSDVQGALERKMLLETSLSRDPPLWERGRM